MCQVDPGGMWAVSRHDDVMAVLRDPARFSSQAFRAVWVGYNPLALAQDGPAHARLRALTVMCERFAAIERAPGDIAYNRTMTVRGPVAARLRLTPG